jgi:hypothetical protein
MSQLLSEGATTDEQIESLRYSFLVGDVLTKRDARFAKLARNNLREPLRFD